MDGMKPVPVPRRFPAPEGGEPSVTPDTASEVNANTVPTKSRNGNVEKPVPLPRKLVQRLNSLNERKRSRKIEKQSSTSLNTSFKIDVAEDNKRGTINLFKRRNNDPFDDFDSSLKDTESEILKGVKFTSPLDDIPPESRSSFAFSTASSSNSSSGYDDYYSEPHPHTVPVSKLPGITEPAPFRPPSTTTSVSSAPVSLCGETNVGYLDTEVNEVYESISSYSSASCTYESPRNDYSSLPLSSGANVLTKRSTVPLVGLNGVSDFAQSDLSFFSKHRYDRLNDETIDLFSSTNNQFDKEEKVSNDEFSGSNRASVSSNNASLKSNLTRTSSSTSNKNKTHEYDDVAMENGNIVFMDNQLNSHSQSDSPENTNSSNSLMSRNSVLMDFDPLFGDTKPGARRSPEQNQQSVHRYEVVDEDLQKDDEGKTSAINESQMTLTSSTVSNPEYIPVKPIRLSRETDTKSSEDVKGSDKQQEREPVAALSDSRSWLSRLRKSSSPVKDDEKDPVSDSGKKSTSDDDNLVPSTQGNFLRRFSHKLKLSQLGPIREEAGKSVLNPNTTSSSGIIITCDKCSEEHTEGSKCKFTPQPNPDIVYSSNLYKPSGGIKKEYVKRFGVLAKGKITFQNEKSIALDELPLERIGSVSKKMDTRAGATPQDLQFFVLYFITGKVPSLTLGCVTELERSCWMQKYIEVFCSGFPHSIISSYDLAGWCFVKEGLTSKWNPSWLILKDRSLHYCISSSGTNFEMDLRKARSISLSTKDADHLCPFVENLDILTIDMSVKIFYIQTENGKITSNWVKAIQEAAKRNGTKFEDMQLTAENVPVIVDKCIDFLYAHGTLQEGIYRQSGANSRITQLLADFQEDSWSVQISPKGPSRFSAHDVAGTLKRFFRTLPEPLVTSKLYDRWIATSGMKSTAEKLKAYEKLLDEVPAINYNILKKLICHLYAVHELHEKNLMPLINLAPIWGPTLMTVDTGKAAESPNSYAIACAECEVIKDLIENYYTLFRIDPEARDKEKKMQDALENFHLGSTKRKCSGDMKMWIYILEKDETSAINITLSPTSTAFSIVQQLCRIAQLRNCENLFLHEVICQANLQRPLHPSEKVIETVLRWSIWDIEERKNNYLILRANTLYTALIPYAKDPKAVFGELKYADSKSKTLKRYTFTFSGATLKYYKDSKATSELGSWKVEDISWYLGSEQKRTTPTRWALTFVKKNYPFKRSKDEQFFGNVICFASEEELHKWIGAMVVGEHPAGLYPSVIV